MTPRPRTVELFCFAFARASGAHQFTQIYREVIHSRSAIGHGLQPTAGKHGVIATVRTVLSFSAAGRYLGRGGPAMISCPHGLFEFGPNGRQVRAEEILVLGGGFFQRLDNPFHYALRGRGVFGLSG